jgi:cytochrome oxidase assembly protein ShyY1
VLVNRGWIARSAAYPAPPAVTVPEGEMVVEGLATVPPARVLELAPEATTGSVRQNLSIARYAAGSKRDVLPVVILASPPGAGLAAVDEKPDAGIDKHREYALTWFSLAVTIAALWVGLNLRKAAP